MKSLLIGAAALALAGQAFAQDAAPAPGAVPATAAAAQPADGATVLATVNGTDITLAHLVALRARLPEQYQSLPDDVLYTGMLDQLIQQQVLADTATKSRATEVGLENETRAFVAGREIERLTSEPLEEAAVAAAYAATYGDAPKGTEYNASHILVATEEEALEIKAELDGGADFGAVAKEYSTGPSGPNGGELGWFGTGMMVPAFEKAVAGMEKGQVSAPVQTQFGWHVIRLGDTREQAAPPLDEVRPEIEAQLRDEMVAAELQRLTDAAEITRADVKVDPAAVRDDSILGN